jgi:hypothetical protein
MTPEDLARDRALIEADITALVMILSRGLKIRGDMIDPAPETFLLVRPHELDAARESFTALVAARTRWPAVLDEIESLQTQLGKSTDKARAWDAIAEKNERIASLIAELATWRAKQPRLDRLADLLGVCEGACPLAAAVAAIEKTRGAEQ